MDSQTHVDLSQPILECYLEIRPCRNERKINNEYEKEKQHN